MVEKLNREVRIKLQDAWPRVKYGKLHSDLILDVCKLWNVLRKHDLNGKMYQAIICMYNVVTAEVQPGSDLTDAFMYPRGPKQGATCGPILFSPFFNEIANEIIERGRH